MDNVIEELSITSLLAQMRRIPDDRYYYSIYATFEDGVVLGSWVEDNVIEYVPLSPSTCSAANSRS